MLDFTNFLYESSYVGMLTSDDDIIRNLIKSWKKTKSIKKGKVYSDFEYDYDASEKVKPIWADNNIQEYKINGKHTRDYASSLILTPKNYSVQISILVLDDSRYGNLSLDNKELNILVISNKAFNIKEITSELMLKEFHGNRGTKSLILKRKTIEDNSTNSNNSLKKFYAIYTYEIILNKNIDFTYDDLKKLSSFKKLMKEYPLEIASTPRQLKNGAFVFALPEQYVKDIDSNKTRYRYTKIGQEYMHYGYSIYNTGYIRKHYMYKYDYQEYHSKAPISGKFDSSTIAGWNSAIDYIKKQFDKLKKDIESVGGTLYLTAEERYAKRGRIAANKFGL